MNKKVLLIGEYHHNTYSFNEIAKKLNFKPEILLVEGPFDKINTNNTRTAVNNFIENNPNLLKIFPTEFFINFTEEHRKHYRIQRGITSRMKVYGIEDLNLASFRSAVSLLCKNYYEIDNSNTKQLMTIDNDLENTIAKIFEEYKRKFLPIYNYLTQLSKEKTYTKNEKILIEWQMSMIQSILKQIDNGLKDKDNLYQLTFLNQMRSGELFDKPLNYHCHYTRNKIFLETIQQLNNGYKDIGIIVGEAHYSYLKNNLIKMNYDIIG